MHVLANEAQRLRRGEGDVAAYLRLDDFLGPKAEGRGIGVAGLLFECLPIDGAAVEPRWRPSLESASPKAKSPQRFAEQNRRGLARAAGGIALFAAVDEAVQKCAGGDDGGAGEKIAAIAELKTENAAAKARRSWHLRWFPNPQPLSP